jgi:hypothetical protein
LCPDVFEERHHDALLDPGHKFPQDNCSQDNGNEAEGGLSQRTNIFTDKAPLYDIDEYPQKDAGQPRGVTLKEK